MEGGSSGRRAASAIELTPAMDEIVKRITVVFVFDQKIVLIANELTITF